MDTKLFTDHSLAASQFLKDKVVWIFFFSLSESQMYLAGYQKIKMLEIVSWYKSSFNYNTYNFRLNVACKQLHKIFLNISEFVLMYGLTV